MASREELFAYLIAQGLDETRALGIIENIADESSFRPDILGDDGQSGGLFQHHGPRFNALKAYTGGDWTDWRKQVDFALTEPEMADYLSGTYNSPGEAAVGFLDRFEKPAKVHRDRRAAKYLGTTIDTDQIGAGAAYEGGSVQPVSAGAQPAMFDYEARDEEAERIALQRLEAIRQGLQPQQPDIGNALLGMGMGILNAGGGPGAGNWFGAGVEGAAAAMQPSELDSARLDLEIQLLDHEAKVLERKERRKWFDSLRPEERLKARAALGDRVAQVELEFRSPGDFKTIDGVPYHYKDGKLTAIPIPGTGVEGPAQIDPKDVVNWTNTIADNFRQEARPLQAGLRYYDDVRQYNPGSMDAAQQQSLIIAFAKLNDPNSAVMEGEAEVIKQAGKTMPWITGLWEQAKGAALSPEQQTMYMRDVVQKAASRAEEYNALYGRYAGQFGQVGLPNPDLYLGRPFSFIPPGAPAKGTDLGGGFTVN
jgi:hypothetical protein